MYFNLRGKGPLGSDCYQFGRPLSRSSWRLPSSYSIHLLLGAIWLRVQGETDGRLGEWGRFLYFTDKTFFNRHFYFSLNKYFYFLQVADEDIPHSEELSIKTFLLDDALLREWNLWGLPGKFFT